MYTALFTIYQNEWTAVPQNGGTAVPSLFLQSSSCRNLLIYYLLLLLSWSTSYTLSQFLDLEHNLHFYFKSGKTYTNIKMWSFYFKICSDNYVPFNHTSLQALCPCLPSLPQDHSISLEQLLFAHRQMDRQINFKTPRTMI